MNFQFDAFHKCTTVISVEIDEPLIEKFVLISEKIGVDWKQQIISDIQKRVEQFEQQMQRDRSQAV